MSLYYFRMIDSVGGFLQHNLVVLLAVVLVPMKWVVLRLCGDSDAQSTALLTVPEDLCYVALGLVLADMANSGGAFRRYFKGSTHVSIDLYYCFDQCDRRGPRPPARKMGKRSL
jgi:hypothetical protein